LAPAGERGEAIVATVNAMLVGAIIAWGPMLIVLIYILRDLRNTAGDRD
jgi:hypothetical protein